MIQNDNYHFDSYLSDSVYTVENYSKDFSFNFWGLRQKQNRTLISVGSKNDSLLGKMNPK